MLNYVSTRKGNITLLIILSVSTCISSAIAADLKNGKKVFEKQCASCHGQLGAGDGPIAAGLPDAMKPRNLQKGEYKVIKDAASLKELLKKGGPAYGLNALMAAQPSLSDAELDDVSAYVISLKK